MPKRLGLWIATGFIAALLGLMAGEALLRGWDWYHGVTPPYTHNLPESIAIPNGYFNFDLQPNLEVVYDSAAPRRISINRWGFRGGDYDPIKPPGVKRVFTFGGSSTFDPFVPDQLTFTHLLGEALSRRTGAHVESVNAGRYGYTTWEILGRFYQRVLRHGPDLVILHSTFNDARADVSPYYGRDEGPQLYGRPLLGWLNKNSALFAFIDYRLRYAWPTARHYQAWFPSYLKFRDPPSEHLEFTADEDRALDYVVACYERNVRTFVGLARAGGVEVLLASQLVAKDQRDVAVGRVTRALRTVSSDLGVPLVDLDALGIDDPRREGLLMTYVHLSPEGTRFVAEKLAIAAAPLLQ